VISVTLFDVSCPLNSKLSPELKANLEFHVALIELNPWKVYIVSMTMDSRPHVTVYADASCKPVNGKLLIDSLDLLIE
jgi:hypothetical protein